MLIFKNFMKNTITFAISVILLCTVAYADILPKSGSDVPNHIIGLYQTDKRLTVYEEPDCKSKILFDKEIFYQNMIGLKSDDTFGVLLPKKELGFLFVVDTSDDGYWVKVIYSKKENKCGWVYKNDDFQFMPWFDFINVYGRKYGIYRLKNNNTQNNIYSNPDDTAQIIGEINYPKVIRLTSIEGNWLLVTILDLSGDTITGYIIWRSKEGNIFYFPNIK